jgi:hypothetical protein
LTTVFTLPGNTISNLTVYVDVDTVAPYTTITAGAGSEGEDQVTLSSPPGNGVSIYASFTGKRKFTVRFASDAQQMPQILTATNNYTWAATLLEAKT